MREVKYGGRFTNATCIGQYNWNLSGITAFYHEKYDEITAVDYSDQNTEYLVAIWKVKL